jgi:hypothetical protein
VSIKGRESAVLLEGVAPETGVVVVVAGDVGVLGALGSGGGRCGDGEQNERLKLGSCEMSCANCGTCAMDNWESDGVIRKVERSDEDTESGQRMGETQ